MDWITATFLFAGAVIRTLADYKGGKHWADLAISICLCAGGAVFLGYELDIALTLPNVGLLIAGGERLNFIIGWLRQITHLEVLNA